MKSLRTTLVFVVLYSSLCIAQVDNDNDGIPESWEQINGLDDNDPTDAFCDYDCDQIINLFEYQLDTDPRMYGSPRILERDNSFTSQELAEILESSDADPVVIRLSEGEYSELEYNNLFATQDVDTYRFIIQGGWNAEFTDYDPYINRTIINGYAINRIRFIAISVNSFFESFQHRDAVIIDGLELEDLSISVSRRRQDLTLSVSNSSLYNLQRNKKESIDHHNNFDSLEQYLYVINSTILTRAPMALSAARGSVLTARIINTTFTDGDSDTASIPDAGFELSPSSGGTLNISTTNSIVWDSTDFFSLYNNNRGLTDLSYLNAHLEYSYLSPYSLISDPSLVQQEVVEGQNTFYADPTFENQTLPHYSLSANSPAKKSAFPNGIPSATPLADIGTNVFAYSATRLIEDMTAEYLCDDDEGRITVQLGQAGKQIEFSVNKDGPYQSDPVIRNLCLGEHVVYFRTTDDCAHFQKRITIVNSCPNQDLDSDNDGMPNDWEINNGLDECDPTDAYGDEDCDQVYNLYEFLLDSDPLDSTSPQYLVVRPYTTTEQLQELISRTDSTEAMVIKFLKGVYVQLELEIENYTGLSDRIMFQGGYDFCGVNYNPYEQRTIIIGDNTINTSGLHTVIYDGLEFDDSGIVSENKYCCISNCGFYGYVSNYYPVRARTWADDAYCYVYNTSVVEPQRPPQFIAESTGKMEVHLQNCTITSGDFTYAGISCANNTSAGLIDLYVDNCTIWDGSMTSFVRLGTVSVAMGEMNVFASNSNLKPLYRFTGVSGSEQLDNITDVDPLFQNRDAPYFELSIFSPLLASSTFTESYENDYIADLGVNQNAKTCLVGPDPLRLAGSVVSDSDCASSGVFNGSIEVQVGGGMTPYFYHWKSDTQLQFLDQAKVEELGEGLYNLTVTDIHGCSFETSFTVEEQNPQDCRADCDPNLEDSDNDGMPNAWERDNNLDECDPADAFEDPDCDQVINLFEYQLQTGIYNETEPTIIEVTPQVTEAEFTAAMEKGLTEAVCIRMQEGDYRIIHIPFGTDSYRTMIQGGWDASFNTYDPYNQATRWDMATLGGLGIIMGGTASADYGAFILDGICAIGDSTNTGLISLRHQTGESHYSFYNCSFFENGEIKINLDNAQSNQIEIINCSFYDTNEIVSSPLNGLDVLEIGVYNGANSDVRILNTSIYREDFQEQVSGISLEAGQNSSITADVYNSVIWSDNEPLFQSMSSLDIGGTVEVNLYNSNLQHFALPAGGNHIVNEPDFDLTSIDPNFVIEDGKLLGLGTASPLKEKGTDLGVFFDQSAPDLGVNAAVRQDEASFQVKVTQPDCGMSNGSIEVEFTGIFAPSTLLEYEIDGQGFQSANNFGQLSEGDYLVRARTNLSCKIFEFDITLECVSDCDPNLEDSDGDGIPNVWELANGLDECDPTDAFCDPDGDQVWNLYEYQLQSDPDSNNSPRAIEIDTSITAEDFTRLWAQGLDEPILIKMTTGFYENLRYLNNILPTSDYAGRPLRVIMQGGWNADFSEYNPSDCITSISGETVNNNGTFVREVLDFLTIDIPEQNSGINDAIIIDGIWMTSTTIDLGLSQAHVSLSNSRISGQPANTVPHFPLNVDFQETTKVSQNSLNIIKVSMQGNNNAPRVRVLDEDHAVSLNIINSSISSNLYPYAIGTASVPGSEYEINVINSDLVDDRITNSISADVNFIPGTQGGSITLNANFSNISTSLESGHVVAEDFQSSLTVDPDYIYYISEGNPLFEAGTDIGLPFAGQAPHMGWELFQHNRYTQVNYLDIVTPDCQQSNGMVTFDLQDNNQEFLVSIDGVNFNATGEFSGLSGGDHLFYFRSVDGCINFNHLFTFKDNCSDKDDDGIPDSWERNNGLDENDPTDAFCDYDEDKVINLFEYQLDTDPYLLGSPAIEQISPSTNQAVIENLVTQSGDNPVVIRMAEGRYNITLDFVNNPAPERSRYLFQGGWNAEFCDQDPFLYTTECKSEGSFSNFFVRYTTPTVVQNNPEAFLFEGLSFENEQLTFPEHEEVMRFISFYNCNFYATTTFYNPFRFGIDAWDGSNMEVSIINSSFSQIDFPLEFKNFSGEMDVRVSNSTFNWLIGTDTTAIFELGTTYDELSLDIDNSILWENAPVFAFSEDNIFRSPKSLMKVSARNSNLNPYPLPRASSDALWTYELADLDYINPGVLRRLSGYYSLPPTSPLKAQGEVNGIPHLGAAPDVGANNIAFSTGLIDSLQVVEASCGQADGTVTLFMKDLSKALEFSSDKTIWESSPVVSGLPSGEHIIYIRTTDNCAHFQQKVTLDDNCMDPCDPALEDSDNDGMPNAWELVNGLDECDPTDAFGDLDCDQVWNLYEFQLQSDPDDENSPQAISITTDMPLSEIQNNLLAIDINLPLVVKFLEGVYDGQLYTFQDFNNLPSRVMFQGGWACDNSYDPVAHRTILTNGFSSVFNSFQTILYDGFEFNGFAISNRIRSGYASYSHCAFYPDQLLFSSLTIRASGDNNEFSIFNCSFTEVLNNAAIISSDNAYSCCKIRMINTTMTSISPNGSGLEYGESLFFSPDVFGTRAEWDASDGITDIYIKDCNLWDSDPNSNMVDLRIPFATGGTFNLFLDNSNISRIQRAGVLGDSEGETELLNVDPVFMNLDSPYFELSPASPLAGLSDGNELYEESFLAALGHNQSFQSCAGNPLAFTPASITNSDCSISGEPNGALDITVTGGAGSYSFTWASAGGSGLDPSAEDQSGLSEGVYLVTVTDGAGCTEMTSYTISELNPQDCFNDCDDTLEDSDNDGMPNVWEISNGLDECDPTDAFCDPDGDQVINLFEFQLQTDLYNDAEPKTIEVTPQTTEAEFNSHIRQSLNETTYIRMQEGNYNYSSELGAFDSATRLMIQGGWDTAFENYDPFSQVTNLRNGSDLSVIQLRVGEVGLISTFIMDGVTISNVPFQAGAVTLQPTDGDSYFSFYNCDFYDNGRDIDISLFGDQVNKTEILNCSFGSNNPTINPIGTGQGIVRVFLNDRAQSDWRVLHTSMNRATNVGTWIGIAVQVYDDSQLDVDFINSNIWSWDNANPSALRVLANEGTINIDITDSNLSPIVWFANQVNPIVTHNQLINEDPLFESTDPSCKILADNSPYKAFCEYYGIGDKWSSPDLGINKYTRTNQSDFEVTIKDASCSENNGSITVEYTGIEPIIFVPYYADYSIDNVNFQPNAFQNLGPGTYELWARPYADECIIYLGEVTLGIEEDSDFIKTTERANCGEANGSITIMPPGDIDDYTYSLDSMPYQASNVFEDLSADVYILYYKSVLNPDCIVRDFVIVNQDSPFDLDTVATSMTTCGLVDGEIEFEITGAFGSSDVQMFDSSGVLYIESEVSRQFWTYSGLEANDYHIVATDENGCVDSIQVEIDESTGITFIDTIVNQPTCGLDNGQILLQVNDPGSISELTRNGQVTSLTLNVGLASGDYSFLVTDDDGCSDSLDITLMSSEAVDIADYEVVSTSCGSANGQIIIKDTNGNPTTYSLGGNNYVSDTSFVNLPPGDYELIATNVTCADTISSIEIVGSEAPDLSLLDATDTTCDEDNGTALLDASQGTSPYTYIINQDTLELPDFDSLVAGRYYAYVIDKNECVDSVEVIIADSEGVSFTYSSTDDICGDLGTVTFVPATGGSGSYLYGVGSTRFQPELAFDNLEGNMTYLLEVQDSEGCTSTAYQNIAMVEKPEIEIISIDTAYCDEPVGRIYLSTRQSTSDIQYYEEGTEQITTGTFSQLSASTYTFIAADPEGCADTLKIDIPGSPPIDLESQDDKLLFCGNDLADISFDVGGGTGVVTTTLFDSNNIEVDFSLGIPEGRYLLRAEDALGCVATEYILIQKKDCTIYIPTTFNPLNNGEDKNFKLGVPDASNFIIESFRIFDRWGNLVYNEENIDPLTFTDWWDGTYNGKDVEQGVYIYLIELGGSSEEMIHGNVTIVR